MPIARDVEVIAAPVDRILGMREGYRRAMACQVVHDSFHARGFTDTYLLKLGGNVVGYGSVAGDPDPPRETVRELFVAPEARARSLELFGALLERARPRWIEAQTNDPFLMAPLFDHAMEVRANRILFADGATTRHPAPPGVSIRAVAPDEKESLFEHALVPTGDWALELEGEVVATGGLLFHYNPPFGDIYMEVAPAHRGRGYGSYLVQELKRICYERGKVPAARCDIENLPSRRTLERAGMTVCGHIVKGTLAPPVD